ncbi:MAG: type VII secretion protein EccCa, partial [Cellulomonas sp.]|nr:type VII secretion protein EccCa [Cellulomonas sp.]
MTTRVVHRPTRTTVPVVRPTPQPLAPPPSLESDQASGPMPLQFLLPVMGATSSVVMMVVLRNGQPLFLVVAGLVFVVALVGGLGFALTARGRAGRQERLRRRKYLDYLEHLRRDLATRGTDDRTQVAAAHPEPGALVGLVADPTRLWERRRGHEDYLTTRVGAGAVDWFDLSIPPPESPVAPHDPYLLAEAELVVAQHATVAGMPVTVDLAGANVVAVIGPRDAAVGLVRAMVAQLACHHGPDDLVLAGWFGPEQAEDWAGLDLLPHVEDATLFDGPVPARRVGRDPAELRQVLGTALADRVSYAHAARRTSTPLPAPARLVVVGDDWGTAARRAVAGADVSAAAMGVTVIHVLADRLDEPDDVDVRIELTAAVSATITTAPGRAGQRTVVATPDLMDSALFVATARSLAPLRLSAASSAPGQETVPDPDELLDFTDPAHLAHWEPREPEDFLRVPFAHDDHGDPVWLDLKESAQLGMGPHGLCVGATGSGKSEMLRTLIVSLVTTHPPDDLSMILVDYKGGAAFAPFAGLPHLAGLIDNLADDPHLTTRARASISGEVVRRQRMLKDAGSLPNIGAYRKARETDPDLPPMPHLLVVIDEFGELLTAEPEFTDLFLQIGRIGRSIGVHLLLASQRLEAGRLRGLDTYLSYRLGLRTFSEAESQMVLDSSDAYRLPALPGYGYLKVDTSVYTRFRAGYVSGPMRHAAAPVESSTMRAALLGPYNGMHRDQAARPDRPVELRRADAGPSVVDTVVTQLRDPELAVAPVLQVWLPPLPDRVAVGSLIDSEHPPPGDLGTVMGVVDDPAAQSQTPWWLDLTRSGGHVAFVGAPASGRTTALRTLAVSLALTRTPQEVAVYGLDVTGGGLARL